MITKNVKTLIMGDEGDASLTKAFHTLLNYMVNHDCKQMIYEFTDVSSEKINKIVVFLDEPR